MKNRFFPERQLAVLLHPEKWQIICSGTIEEVGSEHDSAHQSWSEKNCHKHPYRELLLPLSGKSFLSSNGNIYPCHPGMIFIFDPFVDHDNAYPPGNKTLEHLWFSFVPGHVFVNLAKVRNNSLTGRNITDMETGIPGLVDFSQPFERIWPGFKNSPPEFQRLQLFSALTGLITAIVAKGFTPEFPGDREHTQKKAVEKICEHIKLCGGKGVSLENLSRIAGYSKYHFHRIFKRFTGMPLHRYVEFCRRQKLKELLEKGQSKKEICYELGFSCPSAFSRWLKKNS